MIKGRIHEVYRAFLMRLRQRGDVRAKDPL